MAANRRRRKPRYISKPESPLVVRRLSRRMDPPSLSELAEASGMTPGALSHILCGRREPGLSRAARIARALKVSLDRLHEVLSAA